MGFAQTLSATVGQPLTLRLWASDLAGPREGPDAELAEIRRRTNPVVDPVAIVGDSVFGGAARRGEPAARADVLVHWRDHRGPAPVTFTPAQVPVVTKGDPTAVVEATSAATFSLPGEYVLRAQISDESGESGGGDQCCWTTVHVKVTVK